MSEIEKAELEAELSKFKNDIDEIIEKAVFLWEVLGKINERLKELQAQNIPLCSWEELERVLVNTFGKIKE